ncbi:rifin [Plasmodium sp. gorilla clade G1]|nr:rifin [Plasmodium sp. gorilla clade G1]
MKVHYINILMFALPLNILVYNQRNHKCITRYTTNENPIKTHRSLCECELFAPQNYDKDFEMKAVMHDFDRQSSQRFREYDERMIKNRQKCKEQCEKDIQKIILKDKIEKELKEKLATLETNITTEVLPICECEKSLTDKVEKGCLGCGGFLGSGIAPSVGLLGTVAVDQWKNAATAVAIEFAQQAGAAAGKAAGIQAGIKAVVSGLKTTFPIDKLGPGTLGSFIDATNYTNAPLISGSIHSQYEGLSCTSLGTIGDDSFCSIMLQKLLHSEGTYSMQEFIRKSVNEIVTEATNVVATETVKVTASKTVAIEAAKKGAIETACSSFQVSIIASIISILIIILAMVIIYLILRYRRKKKMKKKLQYIKLLNR